MEAWADDVSDQGGSSSTDSDSDALVLNPPSDDDERQDVIAGKGSHSTIELDARRALAEKYNIPVSDLDNTSDNNPQSAQHTQHGGGGGGVLDGYDEDEDVDLDYDSGSDIDEFVPTMAVQPSDFDMEELDMGPAGHHEDTFGPLRPSRPRFGTVQCRNPFWLGLFAVASLGVFILEGVDLGEHPTDRQVTFIMLMACLLSAGIGVLCLAVWVWFTPQLMWLTQVVAISCALLLSLFLFSLNDGMWQAGLVYLFVFLTMSLWMWTISRTGQLQFASVMLQMISRLVKNNYTLISITGIVLAVQTFWLSIFSLAAYQATLFAHYGSLYVFLAVMLYWTTQVFKHFLHIVVAGTICHWYFQVRTASSTSITMLCARRALTQLAGAISLGSLFVAVVRVIWHPLRNCLESNNSLLLCLFDRIYLLVDSLHERFNKYGFAPVILYGDDFSDASRRTWRKMVDRGVDSIIAEDKVAILLLFPAVGGGCFVASFVGAWAYHVGLEAHWAKLSLYAFWIGFSTVSLMTEIIEAVATTIIVCFTEDPFYLSEKYPLIFHRFIRISEFSTFRSRRVENIL